MTELKNPTKKLKKEGKKSKDAPNGKKLLETRRKTEKKDNFNNYLNNFEKEIDPNKTAPLPRGVDHDGIQFTTDIPKPESLSTTPPPRR